VNTILISVLLLAMSPPPTQGQPTLLDAGYREMYNLQFDEAHRSFRDWSSQHPDDPLGPVSDAAAWLFAEFDRLHILQSEFFLHDNSFLARQKPMPDPAVKQKFENALSKSQALAERTLAREPENRNALFATSLQHGLRADYLALIEKRNLASLREIKDGRALAERLIAMDPNFGDAYLAIGVENYLLSLKPAPVRWVLRAGGAETSKDRGIDNLNRTAEHGHYLLPYARVLLAVAALRDHNVSRAKEILQDLTKEFPKNPLYAEELARLP